MVEADGQFVTDRLLRGRLLLRQPRAGHRAGTDAVLLAAAAGVEAGEHFIDVGAGVGTVGLIAALHQPASHGVLFEVDATVAALARDNVAANSLGERLEVVVGDLFAAAETEALAGQATMVLSNPPFYLAGSLRVSPDRTKAAAHVLDGRPGERQIGHGDWVRRAASFLQPHGRLLMIHRPDALAGLIAAMAPRLGGLRLRAIHPGADLPATRILIGGTAGSRAPITILAPLILHDGSGAFTAEAEALHAGAVMAFWAKKNRPRAGRFSSASILHQ